MRAWKVALLFGVLLLSAPLLKAAEEEKPETPDGEADDVEDEDYRCARRGSACRAQRPDGDAN